MTIEAPYAQSLVHEDASSILRALSSKRFLSEPKNLGEIKRLNGAAAELDAAGDLGLTVSFKQVQLHTTGEGLRGKLGEAGEVYVVATALDGSGKPFEYKTQFFQGIKKNAKLPLGEGGMLVTYLKNPRWFLDVHMLVMESDSDVRNMGTFIEEARKEAKLDDALAFIGGLAAFDPSGITKVTKGVDMFLTALTYFLKKNGDDHIATIHDFYLKHQAFGQGRHPTKDLTRFQGVSAAYQIDLQPLE